MSKANVTQTLLKARRCEASGAPAEAQALYEAVLAAYPANDRARKALARLTAPAAVPAMAATAAAPAPIDPSAAVVADLHALRAAGRHYALDMRMDELLAQHPNSPNLWNINGLSWIDRGDLERAEASFRRVVALAPEHPVGLINLGTALNDRGAHAEALPHLEKAVRLDPSNGLAHASLGNVQHILGAKTEAFESYRQALALMPENAGAWNGLGLVSEALMDRETAIQCFTRAHRLDPGKPMHALNLGRALLDAGRREAAADAIASLDGRDDLTAEHHEILGGFTETLGKLDDAIRHSERALSLDPRKEGLRAVLHHRRRHACDWRDFNAMRREAAGLGLGDTPASPFALLSAEDDPANQLRRSQLVTRIPDWRDPGAPRRAPAAGRRLRVGYFSADMFNHATMHLISGLFREHDRDRFALHFVSYKGLRGDRTMDALLHEDDRMIDLSRSSDAEFVEQARALELDIAIDLKGQTQDNRMHLFARRFAPVQMHFLGYPGTTGAEYIDYFVGDPVAIPPELRDGFSESILYMPHAYQPNDDARPVPQTTKTRADHGLPEDAFVLCCFNEPYKVTPLEFDVWMRVLRQVPDAVLWLMGGNPLAGDNMRREAAARGVDPDRIVIARKIGVLDHRARYLHADLFVDTFFYNAHTTASDALWAGTPVVTKIGRQFAARVAASLLTAAGLPELIARDEAEYEALILALATDRDRLARLRARLIETRFSMPLFDTKRFTRDFEAGLIAVADRAARGLPPEDIDLRWTPARDAAAPAADRIAAAG